MGYEDLSREELVKQLEALQQIFNKDASEAQKLLHNLQVHQIELEMQNRELREVQAALAATRDRYAELYNFAPVGYLTLDAKGCIREINLTGAEMLGVTRDTLLRLPFTSFVATCDTARFLDHLNRALMSNRKLTIELTLDLAHGRHMHVRLESIGRIAGESKTCFTAIVDITQRKLAEDELRKAYEDMEARVRDRTRELAETVTALRREVTQREEREQELAQLFENATEAILVADGAGKVVGANRAFTRITGFAPEEVMGRSLDFLQPPGEKERYAKVISPALEAEGRWQGEDWFHRKSGEEFAVWESVSVLKDREGHATRYLCLFSDITVLKQIAQELDRLAHTDPLTHIPNRLAFATRLENAIAHAKRHGERLALLYMDVDRFKEINDSMGHEAGDRLLGAIAERLTQCVREEDTVARVGGDEFAVILGELSNSGDAARLAEAILHAIDRPFSLKGKEISTSVSIGISVYPEHGPDSAHLLRVADAAMYTAKKHGAHRYQFAS